MGTLSAGEAADLLHMNVKRVQALARTGKLPAVRVGRRWLFPRAEIERLLKTDSPRAAAREAGGTLELSARNQLRGRVTAIRTDGLMAEVTLAIGDQQLVSVITRSSVERLGLAVGESAFAVIKATEIMIGTS